MTATTDKAIKNLISAAKTYGATHEGQDMEPMAQAERVLKEQIEADMIVIRRRNSICALQNEELAEEITALRDRVSFYEGEDPNVAHRYSLARKMPTTEDGD